MNEFYGPVYGALESVTGERLEALHGTLRCLEFKKIGCNRYGLPVDIPLSKVDQIIKDKDWQETKETLKWLGYGAGGQE